MADQLFWKAIITLSALWIVFVAVAATTKNFRSLLMFRLIPMVLGILLSALSLKLWGLI